MNSTKPSVMETTFSFIVRNYRMIGLISLVITLVSIYSYLTTYSFVFGYYFGGEIEHNFSNFELFRRIVPFHVSTMTFTWLMLVLSVTLILYSFTLIKDKKLPSLMGGLFSIVILHVFMTGFFTKEIRGSTILYFSGIWILPVFIGIMVAFMILSGKYPFKSITGLLFGFSVSMLSVLFIPKGISEELIEVSLIIITFTFGMILGLIPFHRYTGFLFIFPYVFLAEVTIFTFFPQLTSGLGPEWIVKIVLLFIFPIMLSVFLSRYLKGTYEKQNEQRKNTAEEKSITKNTYELLNRLIDPNKSKISLLLIMIGLLGAYVMTPRIAAASAKMIRTSTPASQIHYDSIKIMDLKGNEEEIKGIVVAEHDDVIYISNENWMLEQVKVERYHISPR